MAPLTQGRCLVQPSPAQPTRSVASHRVTAVRLPRLRRKASSENDPVVMLPLLPSQASGNHTAYRHCSPALPCFATPWPVLSPKATLLACEAEKITILTHPKLLHAVVDAALVLVDVGPGVARGAKGGHVALGRLGDTVKLEEEHCLPSPTRTTVTTYSLLRTQDTIPRPFRVLCALPPRAPDAAASSIPSRVRCATAAHRRVRDACHQAILREKCRRTS
jgi:hypothetical protein